MNQRKLDKANEITQGKFGISYQELLQTGKDRLPQDIFRNAVAEIENTKINAEFVILGFSYGFPMLIKTDERCGATIKENFAVAGEGGYLAQAMLLHRGHHHLNDLGRTLYKVYEAKKFSEGAPSVGKRTSISVIHHDGRHDYLIQKGMDFMEEKFREFGPREISAEILMRDDLFRRLSAMPRHIRSEQTSS